MNGKVKVKLHTLQDGTEVLSINGAIIPNTIGFTWGFDKRNAELGMTAHVELCDVELVLQDDRADAMPEEDRRRLVQEAFDDGRIIEGLSFDDPLSGWFDVHKSYYGPELMWTAYNYRLKTPTGAKK